MPRERVLMILYYFPPCGSSGVFRGVRFVRGLRSLGIPPLVLTVAERDVDKLAYGTAHYDESYRGVEEGISVIRARALRPSYLVIVAARRGMRFLLRIANSFRDMIAGPRDFPKANSALATARTRRRNVKTYYSAEIGPIMKFIFDLVLIVDTVFEWAPQAFGKALRVLRAADISCIYSSSPPWSGHCVAVWLKLVWRKRWIMDLRDPIFEIEMPGRARRRSSCLIRVYYRMLESFLMRWADVVICNCEEIRRYYSSRHPGRRCEVITNSYDSEDFIAISAAKREPQEPQDSFTISHFGVLYPTIRTPDVFFKALRAALRARPNMEARVRVQFVGDKEYVNSISFMEALKESHLESIVQCTGYVPHREAVEHMTTSNVLLLLQPHPSTHYQIPAKLFEYIAARRPLIAVAPEGSATHNMVRRNALGFVRDPSDVEGLASDIVRAFDGDARLPNEEIVKGFSSESMTNHLAAIIDSLI